MDMNEFLKDLISQLVEATKENVRLQMAAKHQQELEELRKDYELQLQAKDAELEEQQGQEVYWWREYKTVKDELDAVKNEHDALLTELSKKAG